MFTRFPTPGLTWSLVLNLLLACGAQGPLVAAEDPEPEPTEARLAIGEVQSWDSGRLQVALDGVPFDNRCPKDVQCITGGEARVSLKLTVGGGESKTLEARVPAGGTASVRSDGYTVTVLAVEPEPVSTRTIREEDYRVRLTWKREG